MFNLRSARFAIPALLSLAAATGQIACSGSESADDSDEGALGEVSDEVVAAARANLARIAKEIDRDHLGNYKLQGELPDQFVDAVKLEYGATPDLLQSRMKTLASMVFFSAPEVKSDPSVGKITPFHGMDNDAFEALMANEDVVFDHHMEVNGGSPKGVRPFSVCETKFLIKISKGEVSDPAFVSGRNISSYDAYAKAYQTFAGQCEQRDLLEWYNFRGLGGLRPSWLESNLSDRFLRRMLTACRSPTAEYTQRCQEFAANRLKYRDKKNTEFALREMVYDPRPEATISGQSMQDYMSGPSNPGIFVEDRNGDGVGEWLAPGAVKVDPAAVVSISNLPIKTELKVRIASASKISVDGQLVDVAAGTEVTAKSSGDQWSQSGGLGASKVRLPAAGGTLVIEDTNAPRLMPDTTVIQPDGKTGTVPRYDSVNKQSNVPVKLANAISLPVAADFQPSLSIGRGTGVASQFSGELDIAIALADGSQVTAATGPRSVQAFEAVDPLWKKEYLGRPDFGFSAIFPDGSGCAGDAPSPEQCPLLKRFYSVIDRHENFYQTYSSMDTDSPNISQQPSPLVACSITLRASHAWDSAGTPKDGTAGFIYLMRIPFDQILTSDARSIDTLGLLKDKNGDGQPDNDLKAGPRVLTLREVYAGTEKLDMSKVWLDIATLSNNQYSSEHEVSKYGSVPADQIEGILVIRRPAAMPAAAPVAPPAGDGGTPPGTGGNDTPGVTGADGG